MKYMGNNGGWQANPLMRLTLALSLAGLLGVAVTGVFLYSSRMGLDPASVAAYYRGDEAQYIPSRTVASMLEVTHAHLATMTIVVLLLTHLAIFLPWSMRARLVLILVPFGSFLLGEGAGWLVRFVDPRFAVLKIAAFLALEVSLFFLIGAVGLLLIRRSN